MWKTPHSLVSSAISSPIIVAFQNNNPHHLTTWLLTCTTALQPAGLFFLPTGLQKAIEEEQLWSSSLVRLTTYLSVNRVKLCGVESGFIKPIKNGMWCRIFINYASLPWNTSRAVMVGGMQWDIFLRGFNFYFRCFFFCAYHRFLFCFAWHEFFFFCFVFFLLFFCGSEVILTTYTCSKPDTNGCSKHDQQSIQSGVVNL